MVNVNCLIWGSGLSSSPVLTSKVYTLCLKKLQWCTTHNFDADGPILIIFLADNSYRVWAIVSLFNFTCLFAITSLICSELTIFSERELTFTFAICCRRSVCRLSVCLFVCRLSVTLVCPTEAVEIFGNISTALGTLAIHWHPLKISRRSCQGNPSAGGS